MSNDLTKSGGDLSLSDDGTDSLRLRDLEFSDLYISLTGEVLIRGVEGSDEPLEAVPPDVLSDLDRLQEAVFSKGEKERSFTLDYDDVRYRVTRIRAIGGDWFTLRKSKSEIPRLGQLGGFAPPVARHLAKLGKHHGLIVISGATGNGKTTTACSLLREYLLHFGDVAVTIEDPPEMKLEGRHGTSGRCWQLRLDEGDDFGSALYEAMRHTPRYIFMGELRKSHDASQALRAAISGHLVITTIHADTVEGTLNSLIKLTAGTESEAFARELLADGLAGVIHQKLVRGKNGVKTKLHVRSLFPGDDKGIRSHIRDGTIGQLSTAIDQQASRAMRGQDLFETTKRS